MGTDKQFSILVVDDEVSTRELYADVFRGAGFSVSQAGDGLEALEKVNENHPDLVFTGIIMPRMDGFSLLESLKRNVATSDIPVVFSSHLGRIEDKEKAESLGARGFFVLGMTPVSEVVSRVKALLSGGEYVVLIEPRSLDASRLAQDLGIHPSFVDESGSYGLKLKLKNSQTRTFEAELTVI